MVVDCDDYWSYHNARGYLYRTGLPNTTMSDFTPSSNWWDWIKKRVYRFIDWSGSWRYYLTGRVYAHTDEYHRQRDEYMRALARSERLRLDRELDILELGSYRGRSALIWKDYGMVMCVDAWSGKFIHNIFRRNISLSGNNRICWISGTTDKVLPTLKRSYDIIYIDAGHDFTDCYQDLDNSIRLLRPGAILCGDDLEFQAHEIEETRISPYMGIGWHPGVTAAVFKFFCGPVWCKCGFFAARWNGNRFERYVLKSYWNANSNV